MRADRIRAERLDRFKLNNEGVALIYALIVGTVAMVFCLMLLMVSYSLYAQVSGNNSDLQLKFAAETFAEALKSDLEEETSPSDMVTYLADEIKNSIESGDKKDIELMVYDRDNMGNYCIYLLIRYDHSLSTVPSSMDLDITVKSIKGDAGGETGDFVLDDSESYTIKETCNINLK